MAKKNATSTKKKSASKASSATRTKGRKTPLPATKPLPVATYFYRHEVGSNPSDAPLVVDISIDEGRGAHPVLPSFVGFTAEMGEEQWPDQFAFRIVSLTEATVRVMISRVDKGAHEQSWGAKLVIHVFAVCAAAR